MIQPTVGFIVYGVHKDGLADPLGAPFIDERIVAASKAALKARGLRLVEYALVIASKAAGGWRGEVLALDVAVPGCDARG